MKKKILSVLLCLSMAVGMLAGCGEAKAEDWKEYCLTDEVVNKITQCSGGLNVRYNIVDIDNNGIPEVFIKATSSSSLGYDYFILRSFYDFVNDYDLDISSPEVTDIAITDEVYIYNNGFVAITKHANIKRELESIFVWKNYPTSSDSERLSISNDTDPVNPANYFDTFSCSYAYSDTNLSASGAYSKASEFLGTDILSLPEPEFSYTYDELVEALKDY